MVRIQDVPILKKDLETLEDNFYSKQYIWNNVEDLSPDKKLEALMSLIGIENEMAIKKAKLEVTLKILRNGRFEKF